MYFVFGDLGTETTKEVTRTLWKNHIDSFLLWEDIFWNNLRNVKKVVPIWKQVIRKGGKNGNF